MTSPGSHRTTVTKSIQGLCGLQGISRGLHWSSSPLWRSRNTATPESSRGLPPSGQLWSRRGRAVKNIGYCGIREANTFSVCSANFFLPLGLSNCRSIIWLVFYWFSSKHSTLSTNHAPLSTSIFTSLDRPPNLTRLGSSSILLAGCGSSSRTSCSGRK